MDQWDIVELLTKVIETQESLRSEIGRIGVGNAWLTIGVVFVASVSSWVVTFLTHRFALHRENRREAAERERHGNDKLLASLEDAFTLLTDVHLFSLRAVVVKDRDEAIELSHAAFRNRDLSRLGALLNIYFPDCIDTLEATDIAFNEMFDEFYLFWSHHDPTQPSSPTVHDIMRPRCLRWDAEFARLIDAMRAIADELRPSRPKLNPQHPRQRPQAAVDADPGHARAEG